MNKLNSDAPYTCQYYWQVYGASLFSLLMRQSYIRVGHGGALVEAITLNRRIVGSTPALAAM